MKVHRWASRLYYPLLALGIAVAALVASPAVAKEKTTCEVRLIKQGSIFISFDAEDEKDCEKMQGPDTQVEIRGKEDPNAPQPSPN